MTRKRIFFIVISAVAILLFIGRPVVNMFIGYFVGEAQKKCVGSKPVTSEIKKEDGVAVRLNDKDEIFSYDISLKNEKEITEFFNVVDSNILRDTRYAFFNSSEDGDIDEIKLSSLFYKLGIEKDEEYFYKIEFLNKKLQELFSFGIEFGDSYSNIIWTYDKNYLIVCNEEMCAISSVSSDKQYSKHYVTEIVDSKKGGENTIYTVKEYFVDSKNINNKVNCDIYNENEGEILIKNYCPNNYEELIKKVSPDKLNTYEITFDKNNRYVSGKKVS